jgi:hypothetical protein
MANKKFTDLDNLATPVGADVMAIVDDVAGTPTTKKVTATNLMTLAPVQTVAGRTGTVTLSNTDVSGLGTAAVANTGTSNGNVVVLDAVGLPAINGSQLTNLPVAAVDGTAVTSTGETGATKFLREDGDGTCSFNDIVVGDAQLRGTDNPHIGAFPNQSFLVVDNPTNSVMLIADEAGNLKLLNSLGVNNIAVGFSVVEDGIEPDIEVVSGSETYSVITGDSDTLGANGLPIRQGFNAPDIGANPAPLLISGGTIS